VVTKYAMINTAEDCAGTREFYSSSSTVLT